MNYILLASNFSMVAVFLLRYKTIPPQIPLFYSKISGEEQLANNWMIFILPLLANLVYFANNYISNRFFKENEFAQTIIRYLNIAVLVSFSLIFIKIIFLVS